LTPDSQLGLTLALVNAWRAMQQLMQALTELADPLAQAGHPELVAELHGHAQALSASLDRATPLTGALPSDDSAATPRPPEA
jgi:hypothetical protein